ncbi:MAG: prepilin-type N-terminal cleavage/methylation domain-containing protein [Bacillota bacterium]|nr:prepilin-type N-terminal cleavage/methylation domain-containing protein [Bacillota bacterium]
MVKRVASNNQNGFMLVELLIALALLGVVLALGYMFFNFGTQAFNIGERRAIAQQAARITSDFITSELRFAKEIEINPDEAEMVNGYWYFYLSEDNSIIYRDQNENERIMADSLADDMLYSIYFTSNVPDDVVIFLTGADVDMDSIIAVEDLDNINVEEVDGLYLLMTRVQALNLELYRAYGPNESMIKLNGEGGTTIKYLKSIRD